MTNKLTMPAPLDNTKIHTREQYRDWQRRMHAYHVALNEQEQQEAKKAEAKAAEANRILTDAEYDKLAQEREAAKQAKKAARDAEAKAKADEKADYLASMPEVAVVSETNPYTFLLQITHWASLGYSLSETADIAVLPSYYSASFNKPAPSKKAK